MLRVNLTFKTFIAVFSLLIISWEASGQKHPLSLWYRFPAKEWIEALPVGNSILDATVFGGTDRLQLNDITVWSVDEK